MDKDLFVPDTVSIGQNHDQARQRSLGASDSSVLAVLAEDVYSLFSDTISKED